MPTSSKPRGGYSIMCRGMPVEVPFRVHSSNETGLEFFGRPRLVCRQIVNHWTGGEGVPSAVFKTMLTHRNAFDAKEPLSVHFIVDPRGNIYQTADTEMRCVHAGRANSYSIGIEHVGRGSDLRVKPRGIVRTRITETIHGVRVAYDDLTPEQIRASVQLNEALCRLYALPACKVPEKPNGEVLLAELPETAAALFSGCTGHLHHHPSKIDCGGTLLRAIQQHGRALAG